jgi:C-methyltransferase C-terminal domain
MGVATLEFPHLERLIEENQFDTIYHEHFSYFSLVTIDRLASKHGLKLIDVEQIPTHGGSLRVYLRRAEANHPISPRVDCLLAHERAIGFESIESYAHFSKRVHQTKRQLLSFLIRCKEQGARLCGYGAPGKGNTLLNYCGVGTDFLDFTVDASVLFALKSFDITFLATPISPLLGLTNSGSWVRCRFLTIDRAKFADFRISIWLSIIAILMGPSPSIDCLKTCNFGVSTIIFATAE